MTDYLFSDLVSNSSIQQSDLFLINSNESNQFSTALYESNNHKTLAFFKRTILVSNRSNCSMMHLSSDKYHKLLNSTLIDKFDLNYISLKSHVHQINVYLTKLCNQCIFMASKEVSRISECKFISKSVHGDVQTNGFDSMKSQLSFIRNICEKMVCMLNQPWILRNKMQKTDVPYPLKTKINLLLRTFLDKFIVHVNNIIDVSYFIIFTGLKCLSFSNIQSYSDDDFWNFARGIEEFNKLYDHIKSISQSSLYKTVIINGGVSLITCINRKIEPVCFVKNITVRNMFKILSTFRSTLMAERIHRFFYSSKDVFKAIRFRYLFVVLQPDLLTRRTLKSPPLQDLGLDSYRSTSSLFTTSRSLNSPNENEHKKNDSDRKYKKFVQRLSIKMKHSALTEEVNIEYDFIHCLLENVLRSTDMLKSMQNSARKITSEDVRSSGKKSVQWRDSHDTSVREDVIKYYLDLYWYNVDNYLDVIETIIYGCQKLENQSKLGSPFIHNPAIKMALSNLMKEPLITDQFPVALKPCLHNQSLKMQLSARLYMFDEAICKALGYAHDDRFFSDQKCSNTCKEFLKILETIEDGFQKTGLGENSKYFLPIIQKYLNVLSITSAAIITRTRIKYQKTISSWNIATFIFLMFADTSVLLLRLKAILNLVKVLSESNSSGSYGIIRKDFTNFEINLKKLQSIFDEMNETLVEKVKNSVLICINDGFPDDEIWQRKRLDADPAGDAEIPANDYVNMIISLNITSIASLLTYLDKENEKKVMGIIVETIFKTLTSYLLERKLRFSYIGACQLEIDINHIKRWLQKYLSEDIFDYIIGLEITKNCVIIIDILKQQHKYQTNKTQSKNTKGFRMCSSSKAVLIKENNDFSHRTSDFSLDNSNEWLNLRAHPIESNIVTFNACM